MHWKTASLLAIVAWTAWGLTAKMALDKISWMRLEVIASITALLVMLVVGPSGFRIKLDAAHGIGFLTGVFGAMGMILFYYAIARGPVSVVVPLTSMYVVGLFIIGLFFFNEQLTLTKILGVICAVAAVILLSLENA